MPICRVPRVEAKHGERGEGTESHGENRMHLLRGPATSPHQSKMFLLFSVLSVLSVLSVFRFGFSVLKQS